MSQSNSEIHDIENKSVEILIGTPTVDLPNIIEKRNGWARISFAISGLSVTGNSTPIAHVPEGYYPEIDSIIIGRASHSSNGAYSPTLFMIKQNGYIYQSDTAGTLYNMAIDSAYVIANPL